MPSYKGLWSPGLPCLAIRVNSGETISHELWKDRLKDRIRELAKAEEDPVDLLEEEWLDRYGSAPSMRTPEDLVETAEFEDVLQERHLITSGDFPMKASRVAGLETEVPQDLWMWTMEFIRPIAD